GRRGRSDELEGLVGELLPPPALSGRYADPFLHRPALPGVEARADPGGDELVDAPRGELHHELIPGEHGEDPAAHPQSRVRPEPGAFAHPAGGPEATGALLEGSL